MATATWIAASLVTVAVTAEARADAVAIREEPHHVSAVTLVIDVPPEQVYALVTDYAHWKQVFTDIESVSVKSGGREDAQVRFKSRALEHTVTVQFDNVANRVIRFRGIDGPPGGKASGEYVLTPMANGTRTKVDARLYMDVVGVPSLFVRDSTVRAMRRAKLAADLNDAVRWFANRASR